jgi:release factor glutamine methyltransferase
MSSSPTPWTIIKLLTRTTGYFQDKGVSEARTSAEVLLAHVLGVSRLDLYLRHEQPLTPEELARFRALVKRRAAGEPTAYLTGRKEFWSLDFKVTPAVLIPRPETEILVEGVLEAMRTSVPPLQSSQDPKPTTRTRLWGLEIGVGSGALVTVLARELPEMTWTAVDISWAALEVAMENARQHHLADRLYFLQGDLFSGLKPAPWFAVIAANLPYIPESDWQALPRDIREYEPKEALLGGKDGLALLRPMAREAHRYLRPGGWLVLEVGEGQAEPLKELLDRVGAYDRLDFLKDYQEIDRVVRARRRQAS